MADQMFSETFVPVGGKRGYTVLVSIVSHSLIIGAVIMVPVMASDMVDARCRTPQSLSRRTPLPPVPPPTRDASSAPQRIRRHPRFRSSRRRDCRRTEQCPRVAPRWRRRDLNAGFILGETVTGLLPSAASARGRSGRRYRLGGDIQPPTKVKDAAPIYPAIARAARVEGLVIIEATISVNGKVQDVRILRSIPLLDAAALDAVRQWQYTPTRLNGTPVAVVMTVTVNFRLQ